MNSKMVFNSKTELLNNRNYIAFDTETDGLKDSNQFIRISAVKVRGGKVVDIFNQLIRPLNDLSPIVEKITRINNEILKDKPKEQEVLNNFIKWVSKDILVTYNASFEIKYLNMAMERYNLAKLENPIIDVLELFKKIINKKNHNIEYIAKKSNVKYGKKISRELIVKEIYEKYIDILTSMNINDLIQLNVLNRN